MPIECDQPEPRLIEHEKIDRRGSDIQSDQKGISSVEHSEQINGSALVCFNAGKGTGVDETKKIVFENVFFGQTEAPQLSYVQPQRRESYIDVGARGETPFVRFAARTK